MRTWMTGLVGVGVLVVSVGCQGAMRYRAPHAGRPWWDVFPTIVKSGDAGQVAGVHAVASLCGAADDPCWGIFAQRTRHVSFPGRIEALHERGLKALSWFESFGTTQAHIVQVRRGDDGAWVRHPADPSLTQVFRNAWGWSHFDGTGVVRWVGMHNYFEPQDFVEPYTLRHRRYGCVPMTYPDGRPALGYGTGPSEPWTHRIYDAGCAKNVLGEVFFENPELNTPEAAAGGGGGPGFMDLPDPGFTPEEWAARRRGALTGLETVRFSVGKDTACPVWNEYLRASIRQALDMGVDGIWADNFSPWDNLNAYPLRKAFGEWSVASFRTYLAAVFTPAELEAMGVEAVTGFDVRSYLRERCREWGGDPENLADRTWRDPRWLDDPVWRAYLIHKRQVGTRALSEYYRIIKEEGAAAGKPDILVMGNDIPMFGLGWPRGDLDMVSTELNWGWSLSGGSRGIMPPPLGSYVPVYNLAREHARGRFVNIWMYVPEDQLGRDAIARVLYYQGLAAHTLPMPHYPHVRDAGNEATDAAFFGFVRQAAATFGGRVPIAEVGLYYSSSSQLAIMTPQGVLDFNNQTHIFSFWGWGTALTWRHVPWRAVPEWKLTPETLAGLRILIVPGAEVFPAEDVPLLLQWVRGGGTVILAGPCGRRLGEAGNFERVTDGSTLDRFLSAADQRAGGRLGEGRAIVLESDPGLPFYKATETRPSMLASFAAALTKAVGTEPFAVSAPAAPWHVGLTPYVDEAAGRLFLDVNNTDIDVESGTVRPTPGITVGITLPPVLWEGPLRARVLSPDDAPGATVRRASPRRAEITVDPVAIYASVVIERGASAPGQ